jgi:predicted unusual protein kinase regulating ubiquinone biosynthesis (AarF/ABC1/UbiB family)
MKGELGENWASQFAHFDQTPCFSASLGQVHKAVTLGEETVACKLQYPDMQNAVEADLMQLKLFFKGLHFFNSNLDLSSLIEEIHARLKEEVDYLHEAQMLLTFKDIFQNFPHIETPTPFNDLSTSRLLTMTWLEGESILWAQEQDVSLREKIAENLFFSWYYPFYSQGLIHADPHFGNYAFDERGHVKIFDFGCCRKFEKSFVESVLLLFEGLFKKDDRLCLQAYENWGFEGVTLENVPTLNLWANLLYGPLLEDKIRPLQDEHTGVKGRETLFKVLETIKKTTPLKIPKEFVFLDRATVGIGSAILRLKTSRNWHRDFLRLLDQTGWKMNI